MRPGKYLHDHDHQVVGFEEEPGELAPLDLRVTPLGRDRVRDGVERSSLRLIGGPQGLDPQPAAAQEEFDGAERGVDLEQLGQPGPSMHDDEAWRAHPRTSSRSLETPPASRSGVSVSESIFGNADSTSGATAASTAAGSPAEKTASLA